MWPLGPGVPGVAFLALWSVRAKVGPTATPGAPNAMPAQNGVPIKSFQSSPETHFPATASLAWACWKRFPCARDPSTENATCTQPSPAGNGARSVRPSFSHLVFSYLARTISRPPPLAGRTTSIIAR